MLDRHTKERRNQLSNLPGNPHAEAVREACKNAAHHRSQIEATLALAYEQRTANLLKVLELQGRMQDVTQAFNLSAFDVAERLGIEPKPVSSPF